MRKHSVKAAERLLRIHEKSFGGKSARRYPSVTTALKIVDEALHGDRVYRQTLEGLPWTRVRRKK